MFSRMSLALIALITAVIASCVDRGGVIDLGGDADTLQIVGTSATAVDTIILTQDTAIVTVTDTVFQPPDTVVVTVEDTVYSVDSVFTDRVDTVISGTDTVLVTLTDTVVTTDTVISVLTDTVVTIDTVVTVVVDTVFSVDTVIVVDTVPGVSISTSVSQLDLLVGESVTLSATALTAINFPVPVDSIYWVSADVGVATVSRGGTVVGVGAGNTSIFVLAQGVSATVPTFVTDPTTPPPQPDSTPPNPGAGPNEPAGMSPIIRNDFVTLDPAPWFALGQIDLVFDSTAPQEGSVARITYPTGYLGADAPAIAGFNFPEPKSEVYLAMWAKYSENWQSHPVGVNKIGFFNESTFGGGGDPMYFLARGTGEGVSAPMIYAINRQGPLDGGENFPENVGSVPIVRGQWQFVEIHVKMNSTDTATDGEAHLWVDGIKTIEDTSVRWSDGNRTFDNFKWHPIWGGNGGVVDNEMYQFVDYFYISGR